MSQRGFQESPEAGWRALAVAAAAAIGVTLLLAASVWLVWLVNRSTPNVPAIGAQPTPSPTPRALLIARDAPSPAATTVVVATAAPALLDASPSDGSGGADDGVLFSAPDETAFEALATGSWTATADLLQNDGSNTVAEPWLSLVGFSGTSFVVEADIRVNGLLENFCDQSFGLAGGDPAADRVYGGGLVFPCGEKAAHARLTDVSVWKDGYHADPLMAENRFAPGDGWRTYRFEVRGDRLRLVVDGVGIVSGSLDEAMNPAGATEAGIWSQGVDLEVRGINVYPLPSS